MKTRSSGLVLLVCLLGAACGGVGPTAQGDFDVSLGVLGLQAWIDAPYDGQTLALENAPFDVVVHGNYPNGLTGFELSVNGLPYATTDGEDMNEAFTDFTFEWMPQMPGTYQLLVRAMAGDDLGVPAEVQVVVEGNGEELAEPQLTITVQAGTCTYTAAVNLFCRSGPGQVYGEVDSLVPGTIVDVLGIVPDGSHVQVLGPNFGEACFVPLGDTFGTLGGACDDLTVVQPPPTPTPTPTPIPFTPTPTCNPLNIAGPPCP